MDKIIEIDEQYKKWISEVSKRFRQSQIKAMVKVNDEMLRFYWQLGKELHDRKDSFSYGQGFYKKISRDLRKELPDVKSFSETNLRYMQKFAELYSRNFKPSPSWGRFRKWRGRDNFCHSVGTSQAYYR